MEKELPGQDLKQTVDKILNVNTFIKVRRLTQEDKDRDKFVKLISQLEAINVRSSLLQHDFNLGFSTYEEAFYESIDLLLEVAYGKDATDIILWYIYDKHNPDGTINVLVDAKGNQQSVETILDLWRIIHPIVLSYKKERKLK